MDQLSEFTCDVAIIGGGPAGTAMAIRLRQLGFERVLVAEASRYEESRVGESVPPDIRELLATLGVLDEFIEQKHDPCVGSSSSWGSPELGYNDFVFNAYGHGWHLNRRQFDELLARQAAAAGAEVVYGLRLSAGSAAKGVVPSDDGITIKLIDKDRNHRRIHAGMIVDATGRQGRLANVMGAQRLYDDKLISVVGMFALHPEAPLTKLTMLEACPFGWWYASRLSNNRAIVSFSSDADIVNQEAFTNTERWLWHLSATRHIAKNIGQSGFLSDQFQVVACPSFRLDKAAGKNWLAIGDAAASFDPISAHGIYKALSSGILAAEQLHKGRSSATDRATELNAYEEFVRQQYDDYLAMRKYLYSQETRWSDHEFWKSRQA